MYRHLRAMQNYELAAPIGRQLVQKYPDTPAAVEVQQSLAEMENLARTLGEKRRLERLWLYQSSLESSSPQNTATLMPSGVADGPRLILRRHAAWGQSIYLFGSGAGFECGQPCTVSVRFDDALPVRLKASLPPTGEPAVFIEDERVFLNRLQKARELGIEVKPRGAAARTLRFEVGGFDMARWPEPAKKK